HVTPGRQDVVETAVADVVRPAVAADDPDALADERVQYGFEVPGFGQRILSNPASELLDPLPLFLDAGFRRLVGVDDRFGEVVADPFTESLHQLEAVLPLLVDGESHAEAELGGIFEERVVPRRAAAFAVFGPGRRRQISAVDARAPRSIGHDGAVAEELAQEPEVGCLAAPRARARKFEERLEQLHVLDLRELERRLVAVRAGAREVGQAQEEVPVDPFALADRKLGLHIQGLVAYVGLRFCRTDLDAQLAAGAILR